MPHLNRDGVNIYYETHGAGPVVLLSHGFAATSQMWAGQIDALSKNHTLILWDMRGHGRSDAPGDPALYSEALTIGDIAALLDHHGTDSAVIGGLSLGGYMSMAFYGDYPERVRGLLIINTGPGYKNDDAREGWNKIAHQMADTVEQKGHEALMAQSPEMAQSKHNDIAGVVMAGRRMLTQSSPRVIELLPAIKAPSLVVVGAEDKAFLAAGEYMAAKIPNASSLLIPDAGHASNIDQPSIFTAGVTDFLDSHQL